MSSSFHPSPPDAPCLRFPDNLGFHKEINYETAIGMLVRAHQLAQNVPFAWSYVDKPQDGQVLLLYIPPQSAFPNDGIRFQDPEVKYTVPAPGSARELEVAETKYGFIPSSGETGASRVRRRYRLVKGGDPRLVLVHYTRGPQTQIIPALLNQPVRAYPLRSVNEPAVYVIGDKAGQKVFRPEPPMHGAPSAAPPMPPPAMGMSMNLSQQQAMLAQQNNNMEMLERRRERERTRDRNGSATARPPRVEDDGSDDESDLISTRTLAMSRYRRNHELMNDVFRYAAYGEKTLPTRSSPYSIFSETDLDEKTAKLQAEIDSLKSKSAARKAARAKAEDEIPEAGDVSMESASEGITV